MDHCHKRSNPTPKVPTASPDSAAAESYSVGHSIVYRTSGRLPQNETPMRRRRPSPAPKLPRSRGFPPKPAISPPGICGRTPPPSGAILPGGRPGPAMESNRAATPRRQTPHRACPRALTQAFASSGPTASRATRPLQPPSQGRPRAGPCSAGDIVTEYNRLRSRLDARRTVRRHRGKGPSESRPATRTPGGPK